MGHPISERQFTSQLPCFQSSFLLMCLRIAQVLRHCYPLGGQGRVPVFWCWPGPALGVAGIWEVKKQMEDRSISLSLPLIVALSFM